MRTAALLTALVLLPALLPLGSASHTESYGSAHVGWKTVGDASTHAAISTDTAVVGARDCRTKGACDGAWHIASGNCVAAKLMLQRQNVAAEEPTVVEWRLYPYSRGHTWNNGFYASETYTPGALPWTRLVSVCAKTANGDPAIGPFLLHVRMARVISGVTQWDVNSADGGNVGTGSLSGTTYGGVVRTLSSELDPLRASVPASVFAGQGAAVTVTRVNLSGSALTGLASSTHIYIYKPDGTLLVDNQNPVDVGHGTYILNFTAPANGPAGCRWWVKIRDSTAANTAASAAFCVQRDPAASLDAMEGRLNASLQANRAQHDYANALANTTTQPLLRSSAWEVWRDGEARPARDTLNATARQSTLLLVWSAVNASDANDAEIQGNVTLVTSIDPWVPRAVWLGLFVLFLYFAAWMPAIGSLMGLANAIVPAPFMVDEAGIMFVTIGLFLHVLVTRGIIPRIFGRP